MGLPAITAVAGSLFSKLEGLTSHKAAKASTPAAPLSTTSDASSVSQPGQLFSQLQKLSQQNPTEFKKITGQVAQSLQASSSQSSVVSQMASNFQHASQTGSFSDLFTHSGPAAATSSAAGNPHSQYAAGNGASDSSTIHSIFSQAVSQIKTDLGSAV